MRELLRKFRRNEGGTLAMVVAVALPVIIGALAVSIEAAYWMKSKKDLQMTADMAAYAGALELLSDDTSYAVNGAKLQALNNGFDFSRGTIVVNSPPTSGTYTSQEAVEVLIEQTGTQYFSAIFGDNKISYRVRAVAAAFPDGKYCALALNTTAKGAFSVTGSASVNMAGCEIGVNSSHSLAADLGMASTLITDCIDVVGGIKNPSRATLVCDAVQTGVDPIVDPFIGLTAPDLPVEYPSCNTYDKNGPLIANLPPGRYCDNLNFTNIASFTDGGIYVFDGIVANFHTSGTPLTGSGITIILMNGATISGLNGNNQLNVSAATSGPYAGVIFFSDPATQPAGDSVTINGGSTSVIEGLFYFPTQELKFTGNTSAGNACTILVADIIEFGGNSSLDVSGCKAGFGLGTPTGANVLAMIVE